MKIVSWNVNGIRSCLKHGLIPWLERQRAEIVCLQEIKIAENDIPWDLRYLNNYQVFFNCAQKKGYSGVAVYTNKVPLEAKHNLGIKRFDVEGRILELKFDNFSLINLYLPHGSRDKSNLDYKLKVYKKVLADLERRKREKIILMGDFNIAHKDIDLARPRQNKNNIMFTPEERQQIDKLLNLGLVDSFRQFNQEGGHYSWWPSRLKARQRNLGWRIDYCFITRSLVPRLKQAFILKDVLGSDHCPIGLEIGLDKD